MCAESEALNRQNSQSCVATSATRAIPPKAVAAVVAESDCQHVEQYESAEQADQHE
jgi:hypothetical protein